MHSVVLRLATALILALTLSGQGAFIPAAMAGKAPAETCCPAPEPQPATDGGHCVEPDCQCPVCLSIVLHEIPAAVTASTELFILRRESVAPLNGGDYRTIDHPPETA